jgi:hypothetical protein
MTDKHRQEEFDAWATSATPLDLPPNVDPVLPDKNIGTLRPLLTPLFLSTLRSALKLAQTSDLHAAHSLNGPEIRRFVEWCERVAKDGSGAST